MKTVFFTYPTVETVDNSLTKNRPTLKLMNTRLAKYWPDQSTVKFRALGYKLQDQVVKNKIESFENSYISLTVSESSVLIRVLFLSEFA